MWAKHRQQQLQRVMIFMTLFALLLVPFRSLALVDVSPADQNTKSEMPCHMQSAEVAVLDESTPTTESEHNCCETGDSMGCSHCFVSMGLQNAIILDTESHAFTKPTSVIHQLITSPQDNLYKPPRSLI